MEIFQFVLNDVVHITLIGRLWQKEDLIALSDAIDSCIQQQYKYIVLDLERISFISNQGLGLMVRIHRSLEAGGGCLVLNCKKTIMLEAIGILGLGALMKVVTSQTELQQVLASIQASQSQEIQSECSENKIFNVAYL